MYVLTNHFLLKTFWVRVYHSWLRHYVCIMYVLYFVCRDHGKELLCAYKGELDLQRLGFVVMFLFGLFLLSRDLKKKKHLGKLANIFIRSGSFSLKSWIPSSVHCLLRESRGPLHSVLRLVHWQAGICPLIFFFYSFLTKISSLISRIKASDHDRVALAAGTKLERIPDGIRWIPAL